MKEIVNELIKRLFKPGTIFFWLEIIGLGVIIIAIIYVILKSIRKDSN